MKSSLAAFAALERDSSSRTPLYCAASTSRTRTKFAASGKRKMSNQYLRYIECLLVSCVTMMIDYGMIDSNFNAHERMNDPSFYDAHN